MRSLLPVVMLLGCSSDRAPSEPAPAVPANQPKLPADKVVARSAPGTGNVHGVVTFADKPAGQIKVMLCKTLGSIAGCNDVVATTTTGADGTYTFKDVPAGTYGGAAAQVFDTDRYVFMAKVVAMTGEGVVVADGGDIELSPLALFKNDLVIRTPRANQKVAPTNVEITWTAYPEAASYVVYFGEVKEGGGGVNLEEKTTTPSFTVPGPLPRGKYSFSVDAHSAKGDRLATSTTYRLFFVR
jgi:hypothetical protein